MDKPLKLTVKEVAEAMGVTPRYVQYGLQQQRFPFGAAVMMDKRWSYYINAERFIAYMEGKDLREQEA